MADFGLLIEDERRSGHDWLRMVRRCQTLLKVVKLGEADW